jgi:hypothetical protein
LTGVPWSEWITVPRIASRCSIAIPSALQVSAAVGLWLIDQPTTRRLNASRTTRAAPGSVESRFLTKACETG